jgi:hypothetical protein
MNIKLEDIIKDEQKHFVITTDINGINAGSFFVKNSKEGNDYINTMIQCIGYFPNEQDFIIESYNNIICREIITLYPQKKFNSYLYSEIYYPHHGERFWQGIDTLGNSGKWELGDFLIHFAGMSLEERMNLTNIYINQVINN